MRLIVIGECHASRIFERPEFCNKLQSHFEILNYNFGPGNTESQIYSLLINDFKEDDIFLLGGSTHDKLQSEESFKNKIDNLLNMIFTKYKNSKVIFFNMTTRTTHKTYDRIIKLHALKKSYENNINIFCYNFFAKDEEFCEDSHMPSVLNARFLNEFSDYILNNISLLSKKRYEKIKIQNNIIKFENNKSVLFSLNYKEKIESFIKITDEYNVQTKIMHCEGINVTPNRPNWLFIPNLKKIEFDDNIIVLDCLVNYY